MKFVAIVPSWEEVPRWIQSRGEGGVEGAAAWQGGWPFDMPESVWSVSSAGGERGGRREEAKMWAQAIRERRERKRGR